VSPDTLERWLMLGLVLPLVASLVLCAVSFGLEQRFAAAAALGITAADLDALGWEGTVLLVVTAVLGWLTVRRVALGRRLKLGLVLSMVVLVVVWAVAATQAVTLYLD
jgi:hypothetical protein